VIEKWTRLRATKLWYFFMFIHGLCLTFLIGCMVKSGVVFVSPNGIPTVFLLSACTTCTFFVAPPEVCKKVEVDPAAKSKSTPVIFYFFIIVVVTYVSALIFLYYDNHQLDVEGNSTCGMGAWIACFFYTGLGISVTCDLFFCLLVARQADQILTGLRRFGEKLCTATASFLESMEEHQGLLKDVSKMASNFEPWMRTHIVLFVCCFAVYSVIWVDLAGSSQISQGTHLVIFEAFCPGPVRVPIMQVSMVWYETFFTIIIITLSLLPMYHMSRIHTTASLFTSRVSATIDLNQLRERSGKDHNAFLELDLLLRHIERTVDDRWVIRVFSVPMYQRVFSASLVFGMFNLFRAILM